MSELFHVVGTHIFTTLDKLKAKTRSDTFATILTTLRSELEERLDEASEGFLTDYRLNSVEPVELGDVVQHWRELSHTAYKDIILKILGKVLGPLTEAWARKWFQVYEYVIDQVSARVRCNQLLMRMERVMTSFFRFLPPCRNH